MVLDGSLSYEVVNGIFTVDRSVSLVMIERPNLRISPVKWSEQTERKHLAFVVHHTVVFAQRPTGVIELSYSPIQRARPTSVTFTDN